MEVNGWGPAVPRSERASPCLLRSSPIGPAYKACAILILSSNLKGSLLEHYSRCGVGRTLCWNKRVVRVMSFEQASWPRHQGQTQVGRIWAQNGPTGRPPLGLHVANETSLLLCHPPLCIGLTTSRRQSIGRIGRVRYMVGANGRGTLRSLVMFIGLWLMGNGQRIASIHILDDDCLLHVF